MTKTMLALTLVAALTLPFASRAFENFDQWNSWTGGALSDTSQSGPMTGNLPKDGFTQIASPRAEGYEIFAPGDGSLGFNELGSYCGSLKYVGYTQKTYTETTIQPRNLLRTGASVVSQVAQPRWLAVLRAGEPTVITVAATVVDKIYCIQ